MKITYAGEALDTRAERLYMQKQLVDLSPLYSLTNLAKLELQDNPLTLLQIQALQERIPKCEIVF